MKVLFLKVRELQSTKKLHEGRYLENELWMQADKDPSEDWAAAQSVPPTQQNGVHADAHSSAAAEPQESAATGAADAADAKSGSEGVCLSPNNPDVHPCMNPCIPKRPLY